MENEIDLSLIAIWWITSEYGEALADFNEETKEYEWGLTQDLPEYIQSELNSIHGRPLRGRLWVPMEIKVHDIGWNLASPFEEYCGICGGIVIWKKDVELVRWLGGLITDYMLMPIKPNDTPPVSS